MTKFEEEAIKEAEKCGYVMAKSKIVFYEDEKGITFVDFNGTHTNFNFPWLEFAKNWHSDEEFQRLLEQNAELTQENNIVNQIDSQLAKENEDLKSQLQQQALPVVPECVGKDVKRLSLSTLADWNVAVSYISKETLEWLSTTGNINVFLGKSWTLCSLKINGFKVEKPQLFYLKNKLTGDCLAICLARASSGLYVEVTEKWLTRKEQTSYKLSFTQQEIDSMQTGSYEQIPVPVEDNK